MSLDDTLAQAATRLSDPQPGWSQIGQSNLVNGRMSYFTGQIPEIVLDLSAARRPVIASPDAVAWSEVQSNLPPDRGYLAGCCNDTTAFVSGGGRSQGLATNDVWASIDGVSWVQLAGGPFAPRRSHAMATFGPYYWIIGGTDENGRALGDVWRSPNGSGWEQVGANLPPVFAATAIAYQDRLWLIGGANAGRQLYTTADGAQWDQRAAPWTLRFEPRAAVIGDALYVFGGYADRATILTDIWATRDGLNWVCVSPAELGPWTTGVSFGATVIDGSIVLFGGQDARGGGTDAILAFTPDTF